MPERIAEYPIMPQFTDRWSPRAFAPKPMEKEQLLSLFEAARWAPSASNIQPWRFAYALNGDAHWQDFFATLIPFNQSWASNASALVFITSDTLMGRGDDLKPSHSHSFDTGAAWMALALQASSMGLIVHGMLGVDMDAARALLKLSDRYRIEAAVAIGYQGEKSSLPDGLQERESPSDRRPVSESIFHGPANI
ncbi:MAG: nitroreductase family protein [Sphingobium sp.]|nr:nitroreductase family protein [Sphingobium sp.]MCP5400603.1 nitroreductase family protein [Sphingomonas sp.]